MNQPREKIVEILYRDKEIVVVNKPGGLLAVPGRGADKQDPGSEPCWSATTQARAWYVNGKHKDCAEVGIASLARGPARDGHASRDRGRGATAQREPRVHRLHRPVAVARGHRHQQGSRARRPRQGRRRPAPHQPRPPRRARG